MGSGYRWQLGQELGGGSLAVGKGRPSPWKGKPEGGIQGGTGRGLLPQGSCAVRTGSPHPAREGRMVSAGDQGPGLSLTAAFLARAAE